MSVHQSNLYQNELPGVYFLLVIEKIRKRNSKICGSQILLLASRVILHVRDHIMVELGLSLNVLSFKPVQLALIRSSCLSRVSSLEGVHRNSGSILIYLRLHYRYRNFLSPTSRLILIVSLEKLEI